MGIRKELRKATISPSWVGHQITHSWLFWEAVLMTICLILHNLLSVLIKQVLSTKDKDKKLRTIRMEYLVIPALLGKDSRDDVLRLGLSNPKRQTKFTEALDRIKDMKLIFYCNAVD